MANKKNLEKHDMMLYFKTNPMNLEGIEPFKIEFLKIDGTKKPFSTYPPLVEKYSALEFKIKTFDGSIELQEYFTGIQLIDLKDSNLFNYIDDLIKLFDVTLFTQIPIFKIRQQLELLLKEHESDKSYFIRNFDIFFEKTKDSREIDVQKFTKILKKQIIENWKE